MPGGLNRPEPVSKPDPQVATEASKGHPAIARGAEKSFSLRVFDEPPDGSSGDGSKPFTFHSLDPLGFLSAGCAVGSRAPAGSEGAGITSEGMRTWASLLDPLGVFSTNPGPEATDGSGGTGSESISSPIAPGVVLRVEDFNVGRVIGVGGSAVVRVASVLSTGRPCVLKEQSKRRLLSSLKGRDPEARVRERRVLSKLDHPFVVKLLHAFQDPRSLYLALEFVPGGELMARLAQEKRLEPRDARFYAAQVVEAFAYLHGRRVVYRSLKPEDVLIHADGYIKLVDFGFAKELPKGGKTFTLCGTPEYLAPEVILNQGHGEPADWYSLGVLIYEMTVGKPPFQGKDANEVYQNILAGKIKSPPTDDRDLKGIVKGLLHSDPESRIGGTADAADVRRAAWFDGMSWKDLRAKRLQAPHMPTLSGDGDAGCFPEPRPDEVANIQQASPAEVEPWEDVFRNLW